MHLRGSRSLLGIIGIGCVVLSLAKDYLFVGQSGFGFSQFIVTVYGLILFVAVYRTPKDQSLRSDWLRLIVIFGGGGGLALGLGLHYLIDGHWVHFWRLQVVLWGVSSWIALIGVFHLHRNILAWTFFASSAVIFSFIGLIDASQTYSGTTIIAPYLWASFFGLSLFLLLFFASRKNSAVRAINFLFAFILLVFFVGELTTNSQFKLWIGVANKGKVVDFQFALSGEWMHRDPVIGSAPRPDNVVIHSETYDDGSHLEVTYTINKQGHRACSRELWEADASAVFFGGSFTFGEAVQDDETLPCQFGLRQKSLMVHNFGFEAYGAHQFLGELLTGRVRERVTGDPVLFVYSALSDHGARATSSHGMAKYGPRFEIKDENLVQTGFLDDDYNRWLRIRKYLDQSSFLRLFTRRITAILQSSEEVHLAIIRRIADELRTQYPDAQFVVVFWDQLGGTSYYNQDKFLTRLENTQHLKLLRVSNILEPPISPQRYTVPHNLHPNVEAYSQIAEFIVREFR